MYIVVGSKVSKVMESKDAVTTGMLFATLIIIPFSLWDGAIFQVTPLLLFNGFGAAIFSSALPFSLDLVAVKHLTYRTFSILTSLEPAFAAFLGLLFLQEALTFSQWLSICFVITVKCYTCIPEIRRQIIWPQLASAGTQVTMHRSNSFCYSDVRTGYC
ncbi:EamA family transporter [Sphingobacterium sp. xlx-130]|uniref:EamA family transporter n=1 Tax=Sphingobacterium sp. xlx-130 TaxID=2654323 RepID=UPI001F09DB8B|nr:EamA family transporter [Sphingobacterium sp. xlx-130]